MDTHLKFLTGLMSLVLLAVLSVQPPVFAKSQVSTPSKNHRQRYIVILDDPPLAAYDGRALDTPERNTNTTRLRATAGRLTTKGKLDINSTESQQYLRFLDERFESFHGEVLLRLGRQLKSVHRYRNATNGFATDLSVAEARALREMLRVQSVTLDEIQKLHTDSGPAWLGADILQQGDAGFPASGGEGMVVGIFDSGINWDHPSFADPGEGIPPGNGVWDHVNPYGSELGLCSDPEVLCNDKLVGVYDLVEDDPDTDVVEESNNGKDSVGHGSHVASVVAGNPTDAIVNGVPARIGGVAPNANIITYRVCFVGDESDPDDDGCQTSAILAAIDQAITDGVDVVNHSIGGQAHDPWLSSTSTYAFLQLRAAGIFVATSAGNAGPNAGTIGSPANAPWITAVGGATHDRVFASALENLSGGNTTPPGTLIGQSENDGIGIRKIVHAKDYGYALCGTGIPESGVYCSDNTGISNPFAADTFNGEIVVCDRGTYGRVEKGKNLLLAGAGGYVLANTEAWGESTYADDLCLPSIHIGANDAGSLRTWLDSGTGHLGSISGLSIFHVAEAGDIIASFSSRGPGLPPVEDVMKPDMIAPGVQIFGAWDLGNSNVFSSGTSFASPHVAGAAALLKSIHPDWTPAMINSALLTTATPELAMDFDDSLENIHKRGAGRPRLDLAVNAGLYLDVSQDEFDRANPMSPGDPKMLNLPGLIDSSCSGSCVFQRVVTDLVGGASWVAAAKDLMEGVNVIISPSSFALANGASQALTITVDLSQAELVGQWVYGNVRLASNGLPDAIFPLAVYASGGEISSMTIEKSSITLWLDTAPQTLTYDYMVNNTGNVTLTGLSLDDSNTSAAPTCDVTILPPGANATCTASHDLTQDELDDAYQGLGDPNCPNGLYNSVEATSNESAPASDDLCITVTGKPAMTIVKSSTTLWLDTAPQTLTYDYMVNNTGNVTLTGLSLDDSNTSAAPTCDVTILPPGANATCTASHDLTQDELDDAYQGLGDPNCPNGLYNSVEATSNESAPASDDLCIAVITLTDMIFSNGFE